MKLALIGLSSLLLLSGCEFSPVKNTAKDTPAQVKKTVTVAPPAHNPLVVEQKQPAITPIIKKTSPIKALVVKQPPQSLWSVVTEGFELVPSESGKINDYIRYYKRHPLHFKHISKRAVPYLYYIVEEVKKRQLPLEIALLPAVESGFKPNAKSYVSAAGLWQFMPGTGDMFGLTRSWWFDGRKDVQLSTQAALDYLQKLYKRNNQDWLLALASYNAGYGNILKAKKKLKRKNPKVEANFWNIRPYLPKETRHYVPQLLAISYLIKHNREHNLQLQDIKNQPYFTNLVLPKQSSLTQVAKLSDISIQKLKHLNPGYLRETTPPKGPYNLLVPIANSKTLAKKIENSPQLFKVKWAKHKIRSGESLSVIARKYQTSSKEIQRMNGLKNSRIRAGKTLLIPVPDNIRLAEQKATPKYNGKYHYHKVQSGESLWTIARYYNISTRRLCEWNEISIRAPIRKGQMLKIRSQQYGKKITYTLKKGDSLWKLAKRYNVSTTQIARWNQIKRNATLQPGKKLNIWIKS